MKMSTSKIYFLTLLLVWLVFTSRLILVILITNPNVNNHCIGACMLSTKLLLPVLSHFRCPVCPNTNIIPAYTASQHYIQSLVSGVVIQRLRMGFTSANWLVQRGSLYESDSSLLFIVILVAWIPVLWPLYKSTNLSNIVADDYGLPRIRYNPNHIAECLFKTFTCDRRLGGKAMIR